MDEPQADAEPGVEPAVVVRPEPWGSPVADTLVDELNTEIGHRYRDDGADGDGAGAEGEVDFELARVDPAHVSDPLGSFLVAWLGERPVGCGAIRPAPAPVGADACEIKRMYVRSEARGRGVSRALLAGLEAEATRLGYRRVVLETGVRQPEALALYESAGYTPIGAYGAFRESPLSRCYERVLVGG